MSDNKFSSQSQKRLHVTNVSGVGLTIFFIFAKNIFSTIFTMIGKLNKKKIAIHLFLFGKRFEI